MGVNCSATLNPKAEWRMVGEVASILLGAKPYRKDCGHDTVATWVHGFDVAEKKLYIPCDGMPDYIYLKVAGDPANNAVAKLIAESDQMPYQMWYGIERKIIYPRATAAKIALTLAIAKFFGGTVDMNDAESYRKRTFKTPRFIGAEDGKLWKQEQAALLNLKPLTLKDVERVQKYAAY